MMEKEPKLQECYYDDEIDLYELWLVLKRRKAVIILTTSIFFLVSIVYSILAKNVYRVESIVLLPNENGRIIVDFDTTKKIIDLLDNELENKDFKSLAEDLKIDVSRLKSITNLSIETVGRKGNKEAFLLKIEGYKSQDLSLVANATVSYLGSNPFVKKKILERKQIILTKIQNLKKQLPNLQKEAKELKRKIFNSSSSLEVLGINPLSIELSVIDLKNRIAELNYVLNFGVKNYEIFW